MVNSSGKSSMRPGEGGGRSVSTDGDVQGAPGELESVRELLNSWLVPNDTRVGEDRFDDFARVRRIAPRQADPLRELRDDLRAGVEHLPGADDRLNAWILRLRVTPTVRDGGIGYAHTGGIAGQVVEAVVVAMASGSWARLKACPDCRWVFYDHTRNGLKRWCLMTAGDNPRGRSCGSIAKVRRFRERHRSARPATSDPRPA